MIEVIQELGRADSLMSNSGSPEYGRKLDFNLDPDLVREPSYPAGSRVFGEGEGRRGKNDGDEDESTWFWETGAITNEDGEARGSWRGGRTITTRMHGKPLFRSRGVGDLHPPSDAGDTSMNSGERDGGYWRSNDDDGRRYGAIGEERKMKRGSEKSSPERILRDEAF